MLALYERTTEAPEQLKYFDQLYQQRRKPPVALNNTFQEEMVKLAYSLFSKKKNRFRLFSRSVFVRLFFFKSPNKKI